MDELFTEKLRIVNVGLSGFAENIVSAGGHAVQLAWRPPAGGDIDTGLTLNYLVRYLRGKNPASLRICTLLDKPARRLVEIPVDYTGFEIPDQFVVGYGLDYGERYRNLRFVGVLRPEVYSPAE